jgi:predicted Fe-Mo cluster-binding NifX family protein
MTDSCGPNAFQVFEEAAIQVVTGFTGSVSQAVQQFMAGSLKSTPSAQASPRFTGRTGRGMGEGRGGGRGMGIGGWWYGKTVICYQTHHSAYTFNR